jgi:hypothetical protein
MAELGLMIVGMFGSFDLSLHGTGVEDVTLQACIFGAVSGVEE